MWHANHEDGWRKTIGHLQPLAETFPANPIGPDEIGGESRRTWPHRHDVPTHFAYPRLGAVRAGG